MLRRRSNVHGAKLGNYSRISILLVKCVKNACEAIWMRFYFV